MFRPPAPYPGTDLLNFYSQTLDALDGKQSYKTQCCELEEFTDHGADSLTTMFMAMMLASAFKMGTAFPDLLIPLFTGCLVALYTTHSVSYFTHSCVFEKSVTCYPTFALHMTDTRVDST